MRSALFRNGCSSKTVIEHGNISVFFRVQEVQTQTSTVWRCTAFFYGIFLSNLTLIQQEDVVKVAEKCGLTSTGGSPIVTPLRTPEELKSNILKAQADAAATKVRNTLHWAEQKKKEVTLTEFWLSCNHLDSKCSDSTVRQENKTETCWRYISDSITPAGRRAWYVKKEFRKQSTVQAAYMSEFLLLNILTYRHMFSCSPHLSRRFDPERHSTVKRCLGNGQHFITSCPCTFSDPSDSSCLRLCFSLCRGLQRNMS